MRISTDASCEQVVEVMSDDPVLAPTIPELIPEATPVAEEQEQESVTA